MRKITISALLLLAAAFGSYAVTVTGPVSEILFERNSRLVRLSINKVGWYNVTIPNAQSDPDGYGIFKIWYSGILSARATGQCVQFDTADPMATTFFKDCQ